MDHYDTMEYVGMELTDFGHFEVELAHAAALPQVSAPPPPGAEPPGAGLPPDDGVETPRP